MAQNKGVFLVAGIGKEYLAVCAGPGPLPSIGKTGLFWDVLITQNEKKVSYSYFDIIKYMERLCSKGGRELSHLAQCALEKGGSGASMWWKKCMGEEGETVSFKC